MSTPFNKYEKSCFNFHSENIKFMDNGGSGLAVDKAEVLMNKSRGKIEGYFKLQLDQKQEKIDKLEIKLEFLIDLHEDGCPKARETLMKELDELKQ